MAIYAISDLHLAISTDKPMDVFGGVWENYIDKLAENWQALIKPEDTVVMPGDTSWATYIENAVADFDFIDKLNGTKLILKGNHDYWWTTMSKLNQFLEKNEFRSIKFLQNNAYVADGTAICGTRGWILPTSASYTAEDDKMYEREKQRLILSLEDAKRQKADKIIVALHYPPCDNDINSSAYIDIMKEYGVFKCIYGHLHGYGHKQAVDSVIDGIEMQLVSCDYLKLNPIKLG